jgi:hypothetical protein
MGFHNARWAFRIAFDAGFTISVGEKTQRNSKKIDSVNQRLNLLEWNYSFGYDFIFTNMCIALYSDEKEI